MWVDDKIGAVHDDVGIGVVVLFGDVLAELSHIANHSYHCLSHQSVSLAAAPLGMPMVCPNMAASISHE